jgi:outer membrane immunogenic protein
MKHLWLAGAAILLAGPALAADLPTRKAPAPVAVPTEYDWTGIYFGGNLGWAWGSSKTNSYNTVNGLWVDGGSYNTSSFIGGAQVGYRYMFPQRFVIGAEASLDWNASNSNTGSSVVANKYYEWSNYSSGIGGDVVAIGGYAWGDFLPYVKGGWAWTDTTNTRTQLLGTVGGAAAGTSQSVTVSRNGWTIGGGLSYHVWANVEVFGQYMYSNYGNANIDYTVAQRLAHTSLSTNALTAGVNVKF